jgi:hypothetical protein
MRDVEAGADACSSTQGTSENVSPLSSSGHHHHGTEGSVNRCLRPPKNPAEKNGDETIGSFYGWLVN